MAKNQTMTSEMPRGGNGAGAALVSRPAMAAAVATAVSSGPGPVTAVASGGARKDIVGGEIRTVIVELPVKARDGKQVRRSLRFESNAANAMALERHARGLAALDGAPIAESVEEVDGAQGGKIEMVMIELPTRAAEGYAQRSVHVDLSMKQSQTLRQITEALEAQHAELEGGRRVRSASMTIEWILEQIGRQ